MVKKGEQKYILDTVGNEMVANRIIEYLNRNKNEVGYEVFKDENGNLNKKYFEYLFKDNWTKERFLEYLPFFYYSEKVQEKEYTGDNDEYMFTYQELSFEDIMKKTEQYWSCSVDEEGSTINDDELDSILEETGLDLLYLYDFLVLKSGITCKKVIDYIYDNLRCDKAFYFEEWKNYLQLCEKTGRNEWFPDDCSYTLRLLQELVGESIDLIQPTVGWDDSKYIRKGTSLFFFFQHIPVDSEGKPVMRWLAIQVEGNEKVSIEKNGFPSNSCFHREKLIIETLPTTRIRKYDDEKEVWDVIFTGPRNINVDFSVIKATRKKLGLTQAAVSDAIDVSTRTYQKWEKGDMKGISGFFLLRLMRYLNIGVDEITIDEGQ